MASSIQKTDPDIITDEHRIHIPRYQVLLHNDEVNTMEHVVRSLLYTFKFELHECQRIMREAHSAGVALCIVEPLEQAELHRDQLASFSLMATIEPE